MSDKDENERDQNERDEADQASESPDESASADAPRDLPDGTDENGDLADSDADLGGDTLAVTSLLGPERWVQFGFIAFAFLIFFVVDKIAFEVWRRFAQPDPIMTGAIAAIVGILGAFYAYRQPTTRKLADEVVSELAQVTWPSRDETYVSTVVVVVTSVIAAVYTGVFDALWSALTDFVYTV
jgi:preprotein translocase SecE subunit